MKKKIGIALGGGGAKGLAHVPMLEVLDEFDIVPHQISGTSIGGVIGVLYATGYLGHEIRAGIDQISYLDSDGLIDRLTKKDLLKWFEFIDIDWGGKAFFKADSFLSELMADVKVTQFEDLKIPLKVVASDFWSRTQAVFESGELKPALQATMALPGFFAPMVRDGKVYVDGGAVNPLPFDLLDDCDVVIAINVMGTRTEPDTLTPSFFEAIFNTFQIAENTILQQKLVECPPDIYIAPQIVDVHLLEFYKANQIFRQAEPAKDELRRKIETLLEKE